MPYGPYDSPYARPGSPDQRGKLSNRPTPQIAPWTSPYGQLPPPSAPQMQSAQQLAANRPGDIRPVPLAEHGGGYMAMPEPMPTRDSAIDNRGVPPPSLNPLPPQQQEDPLSDLMAPPSLASAPSQSYGAVPFVENKALMPSEVQGMELGPTRKTPGYPFTYPFRTGQNMPQMGTDLRLPGVR